MAGAGSEVDGEGGGLKHLAGRRAEGSPMEKPCS